MAMENRQPQLTWQPPRVDWMIPLIVQRWRFIVIVAILVFLTVLAAAIIKGPVYQATASVLVQLGRQSSGPAMGGSESAQIVTSKRPEDVNNELELMRSEHLIGKLVDHFGVEYFLQKDTPVTLMQKAKRLLSDTKEKAEKAFNAVLVKVGLRREMTDREKVISVLQVAISAENTNRSDVIEVTVSTRDAQSGYELLTKFIELYQIEHINAYKSPQVRTFFETESKELATKLAAAVDAQRAFREKTGSWSPAEQRPRLIDRQLQLRTERISVEGSMESLRAEIASYEKDMANLPKELNLSTVEKRNATLDKLHEKELELASNLEILRNRYNDDSRTVSEARTELNLLRETIKNEKAMQVESVTTGLNEQRLKLESTLAEKRATLRGLESQGARINTEIERVEKELNAIAANDAELRRLDREVTRLERDFALYTKTQEEARIMEQMDSANIANVSVLSPPASGIRPVSPSMKVIFGGGILGGLALPIGILVLMDLLRPSVRSRADVKEILGVPVIARIEELHRA